MLEVSENVKKIFTKQLEIRGERVTENARIIEDLGADSLDIIEIVSILEEIYDVEIPEEESREITTVGQLASYIKEKKSLRRKNARG